MLEVTFDSKTKNFLNRIYFCIYIFFLLLLNVAFVPYCHSVKNVRESVKILNNPSPMDKYGLRHIGWHANSKRSHSSPQTFFPGSHILAFCSLKSLVFIKFTFVHKSKFCSMS